MAQRLSSRRLRDWRHHHGGCCRTGRVAAVALLVTAVTPAYACPPLPDSCTFTTSTLPWMLPAHQPREGLILRVFCPLRQRQPDRRRWRGSSVQEPPQPDGAAEAHPYVRTDRMRGAEEVEATDRELPCTLRCAFHVCILGLCTLITHPSAYPPSSIQSLALSYFAFPCMHHPPCPSDPRITLPSLLFLPVSAAVPTRSATPGRLPSPRELWASPLCSAWISGGSRA
jgi:hypothetical protein